MPCKTVTVPGPDEQDGGDGGDGGGGEETPSNLLERARKFVTENPLPTAGVVGAGIFLATTSVDDEQRPYVPYQPRPADKDRKGDKRGRGGIDKL
jgi:hypothetical protein